MIVVSVVCRSIVTQRVTFAYALKHISRNTEINSECSAVKSCFSNRVYDDVDRSDTVLLEPVLTSTVRVLEALAACSVVGIWSVIPLYIGRLYATRFNHEWYSGGQKMLAPTVSLFVGSLRWTFSQWLSQFYRIHIYIFSFAIICSASSSMGHHRI